MLFPPFWSAAASPSAACRTRYDPSDPKAVKLKLSVSPSSKQQFREAPHCKDQKLVQGENLPWILYKEFDLRFRIWFSTIGEMTFSCEFLIHKWKTTTTKNNSKNNVLIAVTNNSFNMMNESAMSPKMSNCFQSIFLLACRPVQWIDRTKS